MQARTEAITHNTYHQLPTSKDQRKRRKPIIISLMDRSKPLKLYILSAILLASLAVAIATPPGIAKNPSHATCKIKKYKHCYNLEHVCPKFCPDACTVECASCKPICVDGSSPPPESSDEPSPSEPSEPSPPDTYSPPDYPTVPSPPQPEFPPPSSPSPPSATPTPPSSTPSSPTPTSPTPSSPTPTPTPPSPTPSYPTPPTSPVPPSSSTPSSPTPSSPTPPSSPPSGDDEEAAGARRARCKNKNYPQCYGVEYVCPKACPRGCEVDCVTCKPVCKCDKPGSVCQDPRFIGGDGLTFYFHGKKDGNFCLLSDLNLHINGHFIGKRNPGMTRDFTWVQSIAILFDSHRLYIGALKTAVWDDSVDRISVSFDDQDVSLPQLDGSTWTSSPGLFPPVLVKRVNSDTNNVEVQIEGLLKITARAVPITAEDSRIHGYNVTEDDCLAHLDLGFKFHELSNIVDGVLGQTYRPGYVSRVKIGAKMPVIGGDREFETTGLFVADCSVARFTGSGSGNSGGQSRADLPGMSCASGIDGKGVVCKR